MVIEKLLVRNGNAIRREEESNYLSHLKWQKGDKGLNLNRTRRICIFKFKQRWHKFQSRLNFFALFISNIKRKKKKKDRRQIVMLDFWVRFGFNFKDYFMLL